MGTNSNRSLTLLLLVSLVLYSSAPGQKDAGGGGKSKVNEGLGKTWKGPNVSVISRILTRQSSAPTRSASSGRRSKSSAPVPPPSVPDTASSAVVFRPSANSTVAESLATAFAGNPSEKATLIELFRLVKQSYETEVAKDGKSNNLAAALTFFLATNAVAYHDLPMPSDDATEKAFVSLRDAMNSTPEITAMTNDQKQQMHDWLVCMAGFVLAGYLEAKQNNDAQSKANFREVAALSSKIVGVDISRIKITKNGLESSSFQRPVENINNYKTILVPEPRSDRLS